MNLILIRHTKTIVPDGICYGQTDVLPGPEFLLDASKIKEKLTFIKPDIIFASPLIRCTILAEYCGFQRYKTDKRLMEYNFGKWEMKPWSQITGDYAEKWFNDFVHVSSPGGESFHQMLFRFSEFVEELKETRHETVLCFTHSGIIRIAEVIFNATDINQVFKKVVDFGGIYNYKL